MAINRSRDLARADRRRRDREARVAPPESVASTEGLSDEAIAIRDHLQQLPERQRTAVALFYLDDLSVEQVADAMRISAGAVKFHLNKGRENLATHLRGRR